MSVFDEIMAWRQARKKAQEQAALEEIAQGHYAACFYSRHSQYPPEGIITERSADLVAWREYGRSPIYG